ncbi:hypothetical protein BDP27DRAFT_1370810 [Rhodocollybia butyracea]|uniref:Uncharacterized protein n=1 Tax=Rhodocollybia butyracea TaxID=206335 RepID=A0A9P5PA74_9AGAR|nr:hypothetical protein BDP27DRAFT_1370810 [Rhodocollybia butyracea]
MTMLLEKGSTVRIRVGAVEGAAVAVDQAGVRAGPGALESGKFPLTYSTKVWVVVEGAGDREYGYVAVDALEEGQGHGLTAEVKSKQRPQMWYDKETWLGCRAREEVLKGMRRCQGSVGDNADVDSHPVFEPDTNLDTDLDLPVYDPLLLMLPPCTGIHNVIITGTKDTHHVEAWGDWMWQGWAGGDCEERFSARLNRGKIFFYGTLLGLTNVVGTWTVTHEDPWMPAYEGAFTLGKKEE